MTRKAPSYLFYTSEVAAREFAKGGDTTFLQGSLEQAIEQAKEKLRAAPTMQTIAVVQIVRLVRRDDMPFVVVDVT